MNKLKSLALATTLLLTLTIPAMADGEIGNPPTRPPCNPAVQTCPQGNVLTFGDDFADIELTADELASIFILTFGLFS